MGRLKGERLQGRGVLRDGGGGPGRSRVDPPKDVSPLCYPGKSASQGGLRQQRVFLCQHKLSREEVHGNPDRGEDRRQGRSDF